MLRSEIYFAIWDIEKALLDWQWTEHENPAQYCEDLRLGREHFFELLHQKDAEIVADFERRADNYFREAKRHEQREIDRKREEARATAERRPSNRGNAPKTGRRARRGIDGTSRLFD